MNSDPELDDEIIASLVAGVGERDVASRLGCSLGTVRSVVDARMARFDPETVRGESVATLNELERLLKARGGDKALLRQIRRQRAQLTPTT